MSTQQVQNNINTELENIIFTAKKTLKAEGKKKLEELKRQLTDPETIRQLLETELNKDTCSPEGIEKFNNLLHKLDEPIKIVQDTSELALGEMDTLNQVLDPISNGGGPSAILTQISTALQYTLIPLLKAAEIIAFAQLIANSGPTSSGTVTKTASDKLDDAKSKQAEFENLIMLIPAAILYYKNEALKLLNILNPILNFLFKIKNQSTMIRIYIKNFELRHIEGCAALNEANNTSLDGEGAIEFPANYDKSAVEAHLSLLSSYYNEVYEKIIESGEEQFVERMFTLKADLTENFNISFKTKNT